VKVKFIDADQAPPDLSKMNEQSRVFRDTILKLVPGKTAEIDPEGPITTGFKASLARMGTKMKIPVTVWDDGKLVYVELKAAPKDEQKPADQSEAESGSAD
jgi:hypothetical protein